MDINLQKIIYDNIKDELSIFSFIEKNTPLPYGLISLKSIKEDENFDCKINYYNFEISLFENSKSNVTITDLCQKIKSNLLSLIGLTGTNFELLNIEFININMNLFNELETVWKAILNFNTIVKEWKANQ